MSTILQKAVMKISGFKIDIYSLNTVIVGSGAAGFNAADCLWNLGQKDIAIITEGIKIGTSRNTGSDKQTYYKLTLAGEGTDSIIDMAKTLFNGGCMHGDIALVEAALSARAFYKLVDIGVPFPHNRYGEFVGYKTDHDPRQRATSAGPLTSRFMTEKLEKSVVNKGIKIFDGYQVVGILTAPDDMSDVNSVKKAVGLLALNINELNNANMGFTLFNCTNIVYATGGPAGMYLSSVYPESQTGASGIAFEAGVKGINLTESQYGLASIKFRWNVSGTYQQVIPRYVSTNTDGSDEQEFLNEYFSSASQMLNAIFLKGYQWPFDPRKIDNYGSSLIDILVYNETQIKGRRVFLDFTNNPSFESLSGKLDFSLLSDEAYSYLKNSNALLPTPIERLRKMNSPAIELYYNNGIDISKEYLEIAVCAQHNNGGLAGDIWWQSNIRHFFPVGEVNGTFGIYRPGGSALNSTQVGSMRAAQYINAKYSDTPISIDEFVNVTKKQVVEKISLAKYILNPKFKDSVTLIPIKSNVLQQRKAAQERMTKYGAHIRSSEGVDVALKECLKELEHFAEIISINSVLELPYAFQNHDILLTQFVYLSAIKEYIRHGGKSRGSYLVKDLSGKLSIDSLGEEFRFAIDDGNNNDKVCETNFYVNNLSCIHKYERVREVPIEDSWFENIWNAYRSGEIY